MRHSKYRKESVQDFRSALSERIRQEVFFANLCSSVVFNRFKEILIVSLKIKQEFSESLCYNETEK